VKKGTVFQGGGNLRGWSSRGDVEDADKKLVSTQAGCVYTAKSKEWWTMMRGRVYPCIKLELTYVGVVVYRTNLGCGKLKGNSRMESKG